jgi:hypothetical protein
MGRNPDVVILNQPLNLGYRMAPQLFIPHGNFSASCELQLVTGNDFNALQLCHAASRAEIRPGGIAQVDWRILAEREDGNAKVARENVGGVTTKSDVKGVAIIKVVRYEPAV